MQHLNNAGPGQQSVACLHVAQGVMRCRVSATGLVMHTLSQALACLAGCTVDGQSGTSNNGVAVGAIKLTGGVGTPQCVTPLDIAQEAGNPPPAPEALPVPAVQRVAVAPPTAAVAAAQPPERERRLNLAAQVRILATDSAVAMRSAVQLMRAAVSCIRSVHLACGAATAHRIHEALPIGDMLCNSTA